MYHRIPALDWYKAMYADRAETGMSAGQFQLGEMGLHEGEAVGMVFAGVDAIPGESAASGALDVSESRLVIGRGSDLNASGALESNEFSLKWTPTETAKSEWKINSGLLRSEMNRGFPIRDISPGDNNGMYLNAERNLLRSKSWSKSIINGNHYWMPPE